MDASDKIPTVTYASQDEMRFGPRSYTSEQSLVIAQAVAERIELSAPPISLFHSDLEEKVHLEQQAHIDRVWRKRQENTNE